MIEALNNDEISQVYYLISDYIKDVDDALMTGFRMKRLELDLNAEDIDMKIQPIVMLKISEEEVVAMKTSHHYLTCKSILNKLQPIVELIEEAEPEIKKRYDDHE